MWSISRIGMLAIALPFAFKVSVPVTQAADLDGVWGSDGLCNYCQSYLDNDVGAGSAKTSYLPGKGYPTDPLAIAARAPAEQAQTLCEDCTQNDDSEDDSDPFGTKQSAGQDDEAGRRVEIATHH